MNKKSAGNFIEQHAEKLVLGVSGVLCLWLLFMFVIGSSNSVEIEGRSYKPADVDRYIKSQADQLAQKIAEPAIDRLYPADQAMKLFSSRMACTIDSVSDFSIMVPGKSDKVIAEDRLYAVPVIGAVDNVVAEAIRGAAHTPVDEVGMDNPYSKALTKIGDLDLVTVEATFDIAALYRSFKQSFSMGRGLKSEWRDEELAAPVFANAQLQRRRQLENGGWGEWEVVARPKIDQYRSKMDIPETVADIKYDVSMLKAQFKSSEFQNNILQPEAYDFASSNASWLSPSFHKEYVSLVATEKKKTLIEERDKARNRGNQSRTTTGRGGQGMSGARSRGGAGGDRGAQGGSSSRSQRQSGNTRGGRGGTDSGRGARGGREMEGYGGEGGYFDEGADPRRRPERTVDDVVEDNRKILIDDSTPLEEMREMLHFWAHDDSVVPGNTYQFRIRLGVFNPIAGKNWFSKQDESYNGQVLLWSDFSEVTEDVVIAPMVHFFPTSIAKNDDKAVNIQVSKYYLGNWRLENFNVRPGEMIGKEVDFKPKTSRANREEYGRGDYGRDMEGYGGGVANTMPEKIDFATGAMLVDVVRTDQWTGTGSLTRANVADVLYTSDGITMNHLSVKRTYWTGVMKADHAQIEKAAAEIIEISPTRTKGGLLKSGVRGGGLRTPPGRGGMMGREGMYDGGMGGRGERSTYR